MVRMNSLSTGHAPVRSALGGTTDSALAASPSTPTPSLRLRRAAAAERRELVRHRKRLLAARESLHEELQRIEGSLQDIDDRHALLNRLAGPDQAENGNAGAAPQPSVSAAPDDDAADASTVVLRGPAIRRAAVEVLRAKPGGPEALHYRAWFDAVIEAGFAVAGKDPLAVFLTQLG